MWIFVLIEQWIKNMYAIYCNSFTYNNYTAKQTFKHVIIDFISGRYLDLIMIWFPTMVWYAKQWNFSFPSTWKINEYVKNIDIFFSFFFKNFLIKWAITWYNSLILEKVTVPSELTVRLWEFTSLFSFNVVTLSPDFVKWTLIKPSSVSEDKKIQINTHAHATKKHHEHFFYNTKNWISIQWK